MRLTKPKFSTDAHGWSELLPDRVASRSIQKNQRLPWVVVGAGFTGLACTRRLAELHPDQQILLLDARCVGQGASGRNLGFAVAVSHFPGAYQQSQAEEYARVNRINQAGLSLLYAQIKAHSISCQWQQNGFFHAAADTQSLQEHRHFLEYLKQMQIGHTVLDRDDMQQYLGTELYAAGTHVHSGALVHPAALVRGLADSLPNNVTLAEQSAVLGINYARKISLRLSNATIETDKLVLAVNYEAQKLGFLRRRIIGSTLSGSFTRRLTAEELSSLGDLDEWGILSLHGGGATLRLTQDHRICLRNTAEYRGGALLSSSDLQQRQLQHRNSFEKRFPQLAHVPFEYAWSGVEGISRNGTNFFGQQRDNVFLAGGYNGSGVSRGTAFGYALAEYASGGHSTLIHDCLTSAPATWVPPRPFLDLGAFLTVRSRFHDVGLDS